MRDDEYMKISEEEYREGLIADEAPLVPVDRRDFLKLLGGGIIVFVTLGDAAMAADQRGRGYPSDFNAYLRIGEDGRVTVFTGKIEMGQGVMTSLAQMAAEDLRVPLGSIDMIMGDTDLCPYDSGTYGSLTTRMFGPALRTAAARAREVLIELASERLGVEKDRLGVEDGTVFDRGDRSRRATYAELARGERIERTVDEEAVLRNVREFSVMGQPARRLDRIEKVTGEAKYAGDIRLPGLLYAKILRPSSHDATLRSVDTSGAEAVPGVTVVNRDGIIACLHEDPEVAERALRLIRAEYDIPEPDVDDETIFDRILQNPAEVSVQDERGSLEEGERISTALFDETYLDGYVAHAPLEPHTATVTIEEGKATAWVSTQSPFGDQSQIARALGFQPENVRVITPYVGGGFGGKTTNRQAVEAARLAAITGKPVQVAWSRTEDIFLDTFRPAAVVKIRSGIDDSGRITLWDYSVYSAGSRGSDQFYDVPHNRLNIYGARWGAGPQKFSTGAWRAPGANTNVFAKESQVDIMAARAGVDPLQFRLNNTSDPRMRSVLEAVAEGFGWPGLAAPSGRGLGLACGFDAETYVAHMAEVEVDHSTGHVQVRRVVCAQEMGIVVNPDGAKMQMEGCITMGLGYALTEDIRFRGGEILDINFDTYELPRFSALPEIETILVENNELTPKGGGEPPIICMGAVIANAIFDATGVRLYQLPMTPARVREAIGNR